MNPTTRIVVPFACTACGTALPEQASFCPGCGRRVRPLKGAEDSNRYPKAVGPLPEQTSTRSAVKDLQAELPDRYRIIRMIGRGGMGVVFQCMDAALERPVAIKMMAEKYDSDRQAQRRFLREARTQAVLNHINVARVLNVGLTPKNRAFIVMEFVEGKDIRQLIREHEKGLDPVRVCNLARQACEGLAEAHAANIIHRDLKPSNLMVLRDHREREVVKVLDLGLAKIIGGRTDLKTITVETAGLLIGTPAYMSPEQVSGAAVDALADIYALGVVLFEMLTGRLPFVSETVEGWLYQHLHTEPPPPSRYRTELTRFPELDKLVIRCLAKNPQVRPQSVRELSLALEMARVGMMEDPFSFKVGLTASFPQETVVQAGPSGRSSSASDLVPSPLLERSLNDEGVPETAFMEHSRVSIENRQRFLEYSATAEQAEVDGRWDVSIQAWQEALKYADDKAYVRLRIDTLRREISFEKALAEAGRYAAAGDWGRAVVALSKASAILPADPRLHKLRDRMPHRLIEAWIESARLGLQSLQVESAQQGILRRLAVLRARMGDMSSAIRLLQEESSEPAVRIIGLAQASLASIKAGYSEGLRSYLNRGLNAVKKVAEPMARGQACLELGRALNAYGDVEEAGRAFHMALNAFMNIGKQSRITRVAILDTAQLGDPLSTSGLFPRRSKTTRLNKENPLQVREQNIAEVARALAQAGLAEEAVSTVGLIGDAWTKAQTLAYVAEALARAGRLLEAERLADGITFQLPRAQALRAVAIAWVYGGDIEKAESLLKQITSPEQRAPVLGFLAAAWARQGHSKKAETYVEETLKTAYEVKMVAARIETLILSMEPLVSIGESERAEPLMSVASRTIDGAEEPVERLQGFLHLARVRDKARMTSSSEPIPLDPLQVQNTEIRDILLRALETLRNIESPREREECVEGLAAALSAAGAHDLSIDLFAQNKTDAERALTFVGLASGMV